MKITQVEVLPVPAPLDGLAPGGAHPVPLNLSSTMVRIHTDEGLVGMGESWLVYEPDRSLAAAIEDSITPHLIGADPADIENLWRRLYWFVKRSHGVVRALSAVDQALWDLKAKSAGMPLYRLLGGRGNDGLTAYATTPQVDERYGQSLARLIPHGFKAAKMAAGRGVDRDVELLEQAVSDTRGEMKIAIDANGRYDLADAVRLADAFSPLEPMWFEEPLPHHDLPGLAELTRRAVVPIAGFQEESTVWRARDYLVGGALDIFNLSLAACGGITVGRKVAALCEAFGRRLNPHGFGPPVMYAATLHLAYASPSTTHIEFPVLDPAADQPRQPSWSALVANRDQFSVDPDGTISPPELPGLGIELDQEMLGALIEESQRKRTKKGKR